MSPILKPRFAFVQGDICDVTKVNEAPITSNYNGLANVNDDALIFRVQLQVAF